MTNVLGHGNVKMGYGFTAGPRMKTYSDRNDPLHDAFEKYLCLANDANLEDRFFRHIEMDEYLRKKACKLLRGVKNLRKITSTDINALLTKYSSDERVAKARLFLRVLYNTIDEENLVFDAETEHVIDGGIGEKLRRGKNLLVLSDTTVAGHSANGSVVNYGSSSLSFGARSNGCMINFGDVNWVGERISFLINMGKARNFHYGWEDHYQMMFNFGELANHKEPYFCFSWFGDWTHGELAKRHHEVSDYIDQMREAVENLRNPKDPNIFERLKEFSETFGNREIVFKTLGQWMDKGDYDISV